MLLVVANLLWFLAGGLGLLLVASMKRTGPEGPVGMHMVTAPLALGQAIAVACGLGAGALAETGWFATAVGWALPGYVVAMTALPFAALSSRWRAAALAAVVAAVAGAAGAIDGVHAHAVVSWIGGALVVATGLGGYGLLAALWLHVERNRAAADAADAERMDEYQRTQSAWELGEWNKLPANAELWQLIQFAYALNEDVQEQCQARIAAIEDLDRQMAALLRTGWAEHALRYVAQDYPQSRAPLAPSLAPFLDAECTKWEAHLRGAPLPQSWAVNLTKYVDCMVAVIADGGDLKSQATRWRTMLQGIRGLSPLARDLEVA